MAALMLVTANNAWVLATFATTDVRFVQAAYFSGAIAVLLVFCELIYFIIRGIYNGIVWVRTRKERKNQPVQIIQPIIPQPAVSEPNIK